MKEVKGGTIYCGCTVYYEEGTTSIGFGVCGCGSVSECDAINGGVVSNNHPGNTGVVSHGCWSVNIQ